MASREHVKKVSILACAQCRGISQTGNMVRMNSNKLSMDRRRFLSLGAAAAASAALPLHAAQQASSAGSVKFVFFTDTHIEPELNGGEGCAKAFARIKSLKPEFCIQGGDHCIDLTSEPRERSMMLIDLYKKTEHIL